MVTDCFIALQPTVCVKLINNRLLRCRKVGRGDVSVARVRLTISLLSSTTACLYIPLFATGAVKTVKKYTEKGGKKTITDTHKLNF